jgi:uncharacterized protein
MNIGGPLLGGAMIGVSASLLLLGNGRVAGISGILGSVVRPEEETNVGTTGVNLDAEERTIAADTSWRADRLLFLGGLVLAGFVGRLIAPERLASGWSPFGWTAILAGALVGMGTQLGGGCTSGHGVCGISRRSLRSVAATLVFIVAGMMTVFLLTKVGQR